MSTALFDIDTHIKQQLQHTSNTLDNQEQQEHQPSQGLDYYQLCDEIDQIFTSRYDSKTVSDDEKKKFLTLRHDAIAGVATAVEYMTNQIRDIIQAHYSRQVFQYPDFFNSLEEACFSELFGIGNIEKWKIYPTSTDCVVLGQEIWFEIDGEFVRQKERIRSLEQTYAIIKGLSLGHKGLVINEGNPTAEFDRKDGTRIQVTIPPQSFLPTIVMRRFVFKKYSFVKQAERKTIANADILLFQLMAQLMLNTIIAGPVQSGKSTFLKTIYGERDPKKVAVLLESSPESFLKKEFPDRLVHEIFVYDGDMRSISRRLMRIPHHYIIAQEVRGVEAEGAITGTERGTRGLLMTYHITDPKNTPRQLAKHITDEFPSRIERNEIERIAEQLDIGITMLTLPNNEKRIDTVYEMYVDEDYKAYINYLMKYDEKTDSWSYNSKISHYLKKRMMQIDEAKCNQFIEILQERERLSPIVGNTIEECR